MAKNKKITTIEDLAVMVKKGFEGVDKKFKNVDAKFIEQDKKTDAKFDNLAAMVQKGFEETATKKELNDLKSEIMTLRYDFDEFKLKIKKSEVASIDFDFRVQNFEKRIKRIEAELKLK